MPKPSAYAMKLQAQKAAEMSHQRRFTIQWCADAAILAANEVFKRKGEKLVEFSNAFVKYAHEIAEMTTADAKDDRTLEYTKAKLDDRLQELLGDDFVPYDERYSRLRLEQQNKKKGAKR